MTLTTIVLIVLDLIAITALAAVYRSRHHRKDLLTAYIGINVGIVAAALMLTSTAASLGLGLGLFAVLSIIRLRSEELGQHEIAYYFSALALGLIGGLGSSIPIGAALMALVLVAMYVADHPALLRQHRRQVIRVDGALTDETQLRATLENLLGARVLGLSVQRLDLVDDTTLVDVRYVLPATTTAGAPGQASHTAGRGRLRRRRVDVIDQQSQQLDERRLDQARLDDSLLDQAHPDDRGSQDWGPEGPDRRSGVMTW